MHRAGRLQHFVFHARLVQRFPVGRPCRVDALVVGGEYGKGSLSIDGRTVGNYKLTSVSLGVQAGLQSQSLVLMFMTQEALDRFTSKSNWTAGADASVALGRVGANGRIETLGDTGVIAFALTNAGVMAGAKVDGTRISKLAS